MFPAVWGHLVMGYWGTDTRTGQVNNIVTLSNLITLLVTMLQMLSMAVYELYMPLQIMISKEMLNESSTSDSGSCAVINYSFYLPFPRCPCTISLPTLTRRY